MWPNHKKTYLKAYEGKLNFATDTWSASNHRTLAAVTVHLEEHGEVSTIPLDIVEVAKVSKAPTMFDLSHLSTACSRILVRCWPVNSKKF